jgi:hypothetical protein
VNVGPLALSGLNPLLEEAAYRLDLCTPITGGGGFNCPAGVARGTLHPRGAKIYVVPWGQPNFNANLTDGHNSYANLSDDLDVFLTNNREVAVFVKGVGPGREAAIRAINANGISIMTIKDITPIPHNGCRPRRARRV